MPDLVLMSSAFPEPILSMLRTDRVRVIETDGVITLTPIIDSDQSQARLICPLLGIAAGSTLTVDKFLSMKRADEDLEK